MWQLTSLPGAIFLFEAGEKCGELGKVPDVALKEVAKSEELTHLVDTGWWWCIFDSFWFVCSRLDSVLG